MAAVLMQRSLLKLLGWIATEMSIMSHSTTASRLDNSSGSASLSVGSHQVLKKELTISLDAGTIAGKLSGLHEHPAF